MPAREPEVLQGINGRFGRTAGFRIPQVEPDGNAYAFYGFGIFRAHALRPFAFVIGLPDGFAD